VQKDYFKCNLMDDEAEKLSCRLLSGVGFFPIDD
jgi:hypothetical protein